jgi:hypothetical protein
MKFCALLNIKRRVTKCQQSRISRDAPSVACSVPRPRQPAKMHPNLWLRPGPHWGAYDALPTPLLCWGRISPSLGPRRLDFRVPNFSQQMFATLIIASEIRLLISEVCQFLGELHSQRLKVQQLSPNRLISRMQIQNLHGKQCRLPPNFDANVYKLQIPNVNVWRKKHACSEEYGPLMEPLHALGNT